MPAALTTKRQGRSVRPPLPPGFGAIWLTVAVDLVGFGIVLPILPRYARDLQISPTHIGFLVGSFSLAQFVCAPLLGRLSDRIGRKPVILLSLCGTAVGSLLTGLAGTLWLLLLGRLIDGASGASVSVAQAAAADLAKPSERTRLFGLLGAAFGVGFVVGPAIGALAAFGGRHVPFFVAALIAGVNAVLAVRRLPETHQARSVPSGKEGAAVSDIEVAGLTASALPAGLTGHSELPRHLHGTHLHGTGNSPVLSLRRGAGALVVVAFIALVAFSGFEGTFALLVKDRFGMSISSTGAVFTVIGVALVLVQGGLIRPLSNRFDERRILRSGLVLNAAGLLLLAVRGSSLLLVPALALLVLGQGLVSPTMSAAVAARVGPSQRAQVLGYQQSAGSLARFVGPASAGWLYQHNIGAPYVIAALLVVLAVALVPAEAVDRHGSSPAPASR